MAKILIPAVAAVLLMGGAASAQNNYPAGGLKGTGDYKPSAPVKNPSAAGQYAPMTETATTTSKPAKKKHRAS